MLVIRSVIGTKKTLVFVLLVVVMATISGLTFGWINWVDRFPEEDVMAEQADGEKKDVLIYACSGGANVGEVADRTGRALMAEGRGTMWCLAGLGGSVGPILDRAKKADVNLVLDGCPVDCAKKIFENAGITNFRQIKVTDLGIEKAKGVPVTDEQVAKAVARAREALAAHT
ncbi:MAG: putative zinc-binding protein [Planctomycetota bacterium]